MAGFDASVKVAYTLTFASQFRPTENGADRADATSPVAFRLAETSVGNVTELVAPDVTLQALAVTFVLTEDRTAE